MYVLGARSLQKKNLGLGCMVQSILQRSSAPSADVLFDQLEAKRHVVDEHRKSITDFYDSLLPSLSSSLHRSVLLSGESGSSI